MTYIGSECFLDYYAVSALWKCHGCLQIFSSKEEGREGGVEEGKSKGNQAKELVAKYGGAYLATSITLSLISFSLCYALINAGIDVQSLLQKVSANEPFYELQIAFQVPRYMIFIVLYFSGGDFDWCDWGESWYLGFGIRCTQGRISDKISSNGGSDSHCCQLDWKERWKREIASLWKLEQPCFTCNILWDFSYFNSWL